MPVSFPPIAEVNPDTAVVSSVASSAASVTLAASNIDRKGLSIFNDSTKVLFAKLGATASASDYTLKIPAGGYYELPHPVYTGRIDGIWQAANGAAKVTELTNA